MEINEYSIPQRSNEHLYPNLNEELVDEIKILNEIVPAAEEIEEENSIAITKPQPAPRNSIKTHLDANKPVPRPRQFVPRKSKLIENPLYFNLNINPEDSNDDSNTVELRRKKRDENDQKLVLEFDPLAPGKCPVLEEQRRLKLTNSIFCLNISKENENSYDSPICRTSVKTLDSVDESENDENNNDDDNNADGDDVSYCSIDFDPPQFPPPPLPVGFSASNLSLNCPENEYEVEQPLPPPRYAVVERSSPPLDNKPALPPKLNRCNTPDSGSSSSSASSRGVSVISNASEVSSRSFEFVQASERHLTRADSTAPPLPPKNSKATRTKSWNLVDIVRRSASFQKKVPGQVLVDCSMSNSRASSSSSLINGVNFSGYLHKTGSNRKAFRQRWCVLKNSHLKYYLDDKSEIPQGAVHQQDIMSVGKVSDAINAKNGPQDMHCFEVFTLKDKGRCYLFGSATKGEAECWMDQIAASIAPKIASHDNKKEFIKAGYVHLRCGMTGNWQMAWIRLEERNLSVYLIDDERTESFDLRKVTSIQMHPVDKQQSCPKVVEDGSPFHLDVPGRSIFIQANLRKETDNWYMLLRNISQTTSHSLENQQLTNNNVAVIVDKCVSFVTIHGYSTEGIYRLNGVSSKVTKLLSMLRQDARSVTLKLEDFNVHEVASAVKRFFRSLPDPILCKSLYNQWINCSALPNQQEQLANYEHLLTLLPEVNYCTLKYVIAHLRNISDASDRNLMSITNLAAIFGPTLLNAESDETVPNLMNANSEMDVVADLIAHYPVLFRITAEELKKDMMIQKALIDIKEFRRLKKPAGDILKGIYIGSPKGKCVMIRLSPNLTAKDLCIYAIQNERMKEKLEYLSVYEAVCNGELERPLHYSEIVLAVILQWARWADSEAKDNYLVIKKNDLYHSILPLTRQPISMFSELRYADRKSKHFRKFLLEFKNARLSFYRDVKITQPEGSWNIEDVTWYLGCESKRAGPTSWSITFIDKNDEIKRTKEKPYFGHTICCNNEEEFHKWIAAMLIGEYPNGLIAKKDAVNLL